MKKEFYSTIEAAKILRLSRIAVFRWVKNGKLKAIRVGRNYIIPHKDLLEALGKEIGTSKKLAIDKAVKKAMKDFKETFKLLGRE